MLLYVVPLAIGGLLIFVLVRIFGSSPPPPTPVLQVKEPSTPRSSHYALNYPPPGAAGSPFASASPVVASTPRKLSASRDSPVATSAQASRSGSSLVPSTPRLVSQTPRSGSQISGVPATPRSALRTSLTSDGVPLTPRRTAGSFLGEMRSPRVIELPSDMPTVLRPIANNKKKKNRSSTGADEGAESSSEEEPQPATPPRAQTSSSPLVTSSTTSPLLLPSLNPEPPVLVEQKQRRAELELDKRLLRLSEDQLNKSGLAEALMSPRAREAKVASFDDLWQQREQAEKRAVEERERIEKFKQFVASAAVESPQRLAALEEEQRKARQAAEQRLLEEQAQKVQREEERRRQMEAEERERLIIAERAAQMTAEEQERAIFAERQRQMAEEERERAAMELRRKMLEEEATERAQLEARLQREREAVQKEEDTAVKSADTLAAASTPHEVPVAEVIVDDEMIVNENSSHPDISSAVTQPKAKRRSKKPPREKAVSTELPSITELPQEQNSNLVPTISVTVAEPGVESSRELDLSAASQPEPAQNHTTKSNAPTKTSILETSTSAPAEHDTAAAIVPEGANGSAPPRTGSSARPDVPHHILYWTALNVHSNARSKAQITREADPEGTSSVKSDPVVEEPATRDCDLTEPDTTTGEITLEEFPSGTAADASPSEIEVAASETAAAAAENLQTTPQPKEAAPPHPPAAHEPPNHLLYWYTLHVTRPKCERGDSQHPSHAHSPSAALTRRWSAIEAKLATLSDRLSALEAENRTHV